MWMTALIDLCLLVNLVITLVLFVLVTEAESVVLWARRRLRRGEDGWFDEPTAPEADGVAAVRLWARWMWFIVVAWGLLTGFLVGLYWQGWFWRF